MSVTPISPNPGQDARRPKEEIRLPVCLSGSIDPPPRSAAAGTAVVLLTIALLSLAMAVTGAMDKWILAAVIVLMSLATFLRSIYAVHMTLIALAWLLFAGLEPSLQWPFSKLAPLTVYALVVVFIPPLRHSVGWLRTGRSAPEVRRTVITVALVSGAALVAWVMLKQPDLRHHLASIPAMPLWVYPLAATGFACCNAAMEEAVFRGIMMEALESAIGEGFWSNAIQSVSFAAFHYLAGFPNGASGFLMVLAYGFLLGTVRRRSGGLLAPLVAHIAADLVIFAVLAFIVFRS